MNKKINQSTNRDIALRLSIFVLSILCSFHCVYANELNNQSIIKLTSENISDTLIFKLIDKSQCNFSLSDTDIIFLKKRGVSEKLIIPIKKLDIATLDSLSIRC